MLRKKDAAAAATPKDVVARWDAEGATVDKRIARAASSLAWYRRALKRRGLKAATREAYKRQAATYEALLATLRAERDAAKAGGAS